MVFITAAIEPYLPDAERQRLSGNNLTNSHSGVNIATIVEFSNEILTACISTNEGSAVFIINNLSVHVA